MGINFRGTNFREIYLASNCEIKLTPKKVDFDKNVIKFRTLSISYSQRIETL